jgi:hypothetical protein
MPVRTFNLNGDGCQTISITQQGAGTPITISLNDRFLGTLPPPEKLHTGRDFKLNDGSTITVRGVNEQIEVRHKGRRLVETGSTPAVQRTALARRDSVTKGIVLLCELFVAVLGTAALCFILVKVLAPVIVMILTWLMSWLLSGLS